MMVSTRQTAQKRRTAVLAAAVTEFAHSGYAGTSTNAIAIRAGISQPYLFRLFGTKKELFIATFDQVGGRITKELAAAAQGVTGDDAMIAMGTAYLELMQDQTCCACRCTDSRPPREIRISQRRAGGPSKPSGTWSMTRLTSRPRRSQISSLTGC